MSLTIAVTGLNATDNPAPGVPVIRAIRAAYPGCRIVGLAYDALDPGNYMQEVADHVYLMPYPSQGAEVLTARIEAICQHTPIDVIVPCLDAELAAYIKAEDALLDLGIRMVLPNETALALRSKARLHELMDRFEIRVPKSRAICDRAAIAKLDTELSYPLMVKGQFYDAHIAYTPGEVRLWFDRYASKWGLPVVVQEYVGGTEYDIVCVGDGLGGLVGSVPMRKMQLTDKGKAWGGVTVADQDLEAFVEHAMRQLKWNGPCELEVMKSHETGELYLIEINPRFPAWVYLTVGCGRNLPEAVIRLALGQKTKPMAPAPAGIMFLRHSFDQICTLTDYESLTTVGELHRAQHSDRTQQTDRARQTEQSVEVMT